MRQASRCAALAKMVTSSSAASRAKRRCACCGQEGRLRSGCGCHGGKSHACLLGYVCERVEAPVEPKNSTGNGSSASSATPSSTAGDAPPDAAPKTAVPKTPNSGPDGAPNTADHAADASSCSTAGAGIKVSVTANGNNIKVCVKVDAQTV